ncbi:MAG: hydrogenase maturation nickel metallochaperone HypA [Thermacetogeniaceae bacterium]
MHELSLMESVVKQLHSSAAENGIKRITRVMLVVGKMTMAVPDALRFAFDALQKGDELLEGAVLEIREEPVRCECRDCGHSYDAPNYEFICPSCSSPNIKITRGRELYIDFYEGD